MTPPAAAKRQPDDGFLRNARKIWAVRGVLLAVAAGTITATVKTYDLLAAQSSILKEQGEIKADLDAHVAAPSHGDSKTAQALLGQRVDQLIESFREFKEQHAEDMDYIRQKLDALGRTRHAKEGDP